MIGLPSGPNGSHEAHNAFGGTNAEETWNMFLGDGYPDGSTQIMYTVSHAGLPHRALEFANKRVGHNWKNHYYYQNQTSYGGFYIRFMPIRNNGNAAVNVPIYAYASSYKQVSTAVVHGVISHRQTAVVRFTRLLPAERGRIRVLTPAAITTTTSLVVRLYLYRQEQPFWLACAHQRSTRQPMCL